MGGLKVLIAKAKESAFLLSCMGMQDMLNSRKELSIRSHTSFMYSLILCCLDL
jgi:hypothetical protein